MTAAAAAAMGGGERPEVRGSGSMVHMKKLTPKRRFEWQERNYVRNCVFFLRPALWTPALDSN